MPSLTEELKQLRKRFGAISGWIFGGQRKSDQPMDRHLFDKWLHVAGRRRSFRSSCADYRTLSTEVDDRAKHHSLKDVAAAGGWKDTETLLTCYQHPDTDTLLAVISEARKVCDAAGRDRSEAME